MLICFVGSAVESSAPLWLWRKSDSYIRLDHLNPRRLNSTRHFESDGEFLDRVLVERCVPIVFDTHMNLLPGLGRLILPQTSLGAQRHHVRWVWWVEDG